MRTKLVCGNGALLVSALFVCLLTPGLASARQHRADIVSHYTVTTYVSTNRSGAWIGIIADPQLHELVAYGSGPNNDQAQVISIEESPIAAKAATSSGTLLAMQHGSAVAALLPESGCILVHGRISSTGMNMFSPSIQVCETRDGITVEAMRLSLSARPHGLRSEVHRVSITLSSPVVGEELFLVQVSGGHLVYGKLHTEGGGVGAFAHM